MAMVLGARPPGAGAVNPYAGVTNYWTLESALTPWPDSIDAKPLSRHASFPAPTHVAGKNGFGKQMIAGSVSIMRSTPHTFNWTGLWTLALWYKPENANAIILDNRSPTSLYFGWSNTTGKFNFYIDGGATNYLGTLVIGLGSYHHVVLVGDGASSTKLYVNGVLDGVVAPNVTLTPAGELWLYNATYDEVAMFEGVAIAQPQVTALYNGSAGVFL
jgi:hypothetical protein